ncbi:hypothetical protein FQN60_002496, partial [Etheostoma spectabile]
MPHRVTLCRWRKQVKQDKRILEEEKGKPQSQRGIPVLYVADLGLWTQVTPFTKDNFIVSWSGVLRHPRLRCGSPVSAPHRMLERFPEPRSGTSKKGWGGRLSARHRRATLQAPLPLDPPGESTHPASCVSPPALPPCLSLPPQAPQAAHLPAVPPAGTKRLWAQSFGWDKLLCPVHRK